MLQFYSEDRCQTCPDRVVCRCLQVTESEIVDTITTLTIRTVKDLRRATGAGEGCTCCHEHLKDLIERHRGSHCDRQEHHPHELGSPHSTPLLSPAS